MADDRRRQYRGFALVKSLTTTASQPLGFTGENIAATARFFDARQTIYSQYANSPVLLELVERFNDAFDRQQDFDAFYAAIWDIDTATSAGLDIWGRIVGVGRALYVSDGSFLGFNEATDAQDFGEGIFYSGDRLTANFSLTDTAYRRVIMAKAAANITDGSIPSFNAILMTLFPDHGNCYVRDNGDMTMTLVFGTALSKVDYAIVTQSGVLPKPIGVSFTVEQS